jgi:iron complex outermembrane recepter protein
MRFALSCLALCAAPAAPAAFAQTVPPPPAPAAQGNDVVRAADDAFGRRIGIEDVGLYSEGEVRGFDLQSAGNYRIENHYFVRASGLPVSFLEETAIRVGANGLRTDFAAPSGVVQYDLVRPAPGVGASIEAGWWGGSGPVLLARFRAATPDAGLGVAGGVQLNPRQAYSDGTGGDYAAAVAIPRWSPAPGVRLTAIVGHSWFERGADTGFVTAGGQAPPRVRRGVERSQPWMEPRTNYGITGLIGEVDRGAWRFGASAFVSDFEDMFGAFNIIRFPGGGAPAENNVLLTPRELHRSISAEAVAERSFATGSLRHRAVAMVRRRDSIARTSPGVFLSLGSIADVDAPPEIARPAFAFDPRLVHDDVGQWAGGLGYRLSAGDDFEVRADVQKARYVKQVTALDGTVTRQASTPWLYSASLSVGLTPRLTGFASYARGLEESGVAPGNAVNRGAILPATISRQAELGAKYSIPGGPALIAGVFDIAKPVAGLSAGGVYDFVGDVRHRGVELSLAGPLTERLSAVLGATWLDARISGELVDRGVIGQRPIGRPGVVALANLTWQVPGVEGLAIDGGVNLRGSREANAANSESLPGYATLQAGLRQRFVLDGKPLTVRARVTNILDQFAWAATSSGLFFHNGPRVFTLTLTGEL